VDVCGDIFVDTFVGAVAVDIVVGKVEEVAVTPVPAEVEEGTDVTIVEILDVVAIVGEDVVGAIEVASDEVATFVLDVTAALVLVLV
jgi:hypothetical protein